MRLLVAAAHTRTHTHTLSIALNLPGFARLWCCVGRTDEAYLPDARMLLHERLGGLCGTQELELSPPHGRFITDVLPVLYIHTQAGRERECVCACVCECVCLCELGRDEVVFIIILMHQCH